MPERAQSERANAQPGQPQATNSRTGSSAKTLSTGPVLAFDFGEKRIGVAVGDTAIRIAHPLEPIAFEDNRRRFDAVAALVQEWQPVRLVLGIPNGIAANDHPLASRVRRFAQRLSARFALPVDLIDETLTSWEASRRLSRLGVVARAQKKHIDGMAACAILEAWFEHPHSDAAGSGR